MYNPNKWYPQPRPVPPYRDDYEYREPSSYRQETWRPPVPPPPPRFHDRTSPSPERYPRQRSESWNQAQSWRSPEGSTWAERRSPHYHPPSSFEEPIPAGRGDRRDMVAERMFEPSSNWRQSHVPDSSDRMHRGRRYIDDFPTERALPPDIPPPPEDYVDPPLPDYPDRSYRPWSPPASYREPYPAPPPIPSPSRYETYRPPYLERAPGWAAQSPTSPRTAHFEPRRERSFTHPMRPSPRTETFDREYPSHPGHPGQSHSGHERSYSAGGPLPSLSTSPRFRNTITGGRPSGRGSRDFSSYDPDQHIRKTSPTTSTHSGSRPVVRSRSSSRSSEFRRPLPRLEVAIPNGSYARTDSNVVNMDSTTSTPRRDGFQPHRNELPPLRSPIKDNFAFGGRNRQYTPGPHRTSPRSDGYENTSPSPTFQPRSPVYRRRATPPPSQSIRASSSMPPVLVPSSEMGDLHMEIEPTSREPVQRPPSGFRISHAQESTIDRDREASFAEDNATVEERRDSVPRVVTDPRGVPEPRERTQTPPQLPPVPPTLAEIQTDAPTPAETPAVETPPVIPLPPPEVPVPAEPLPPIEDDKPLPEVLRLIVSMRLRCDMQTREERVGPVLLSNRSIAEPPHPTEPDSPPKSPTAVVRESLEAHREELQQSYEANKPSLEVLFAQRQVDLNEKVERLREEYLSLHERWVGHCTKLDEVAKAGALEEAAATAGRTTRRSATTLGDAVRSDLEMEQIIASLGNEELTDANHLAAKNAAVIPDMISVTKGAVEFLYDDTNNEVFDPAMFYAPRTGFKDWTEDEQRVFLEKYAEHPKQFGIIASFLPEKTTSQCVNYYYLHKKKHLDFRKVVARFATGKRRRGGRRAAADKKRGNALLTDILQRDAEVSRDPTPVSSAGRRTRPVVATAGESKKSTVGRRHIHLEDTPTPTSTPDPEGEPRKKRRRVTTARAQAAQEQEAVLDEIEEEAKPKRGRRGRKPKTIDTLDGHSTATPPREFHPPMPETKFIDQTEMIARRKAIQTAGIWSEEDKVLFLSLFKEHGEDFKRIASAMPNKTTAQVTAFHQARQYDFGIRGKPLLGRSYSPDGARSATYGSRVMTPNSSTIHTSPEEMSYNGTTLETRFRVNPVFPGEMPIQFHSTTPESMEAHYAQREARQFAQSQAMLQAPYPGYEFQGVMPMRVPMGQEHIANPSPFAQSTPLTTTFPSSFPYTNLSPSNFAGPTERLPPMPAGRGGALHPGQQLPPYPHPSWGIPPNDMPVYRS